MTEENKIKNEIVEPSTLPGFIELMPREQMAFNNLIDIIRNTYEKYGFIPVDTPVLEKSEVLLAKSGGDTAKQVYRFEKGDSDISMRFDLTVPLARYVAQHYNELAFPFRRYHIGKVYRGERPQRGRFREFYQCDIDIIGNEKLSIVNDAEILSVIYTTFTELGLGDFTIRINNRKILNGFFESIGVENKIEVMRIVDKIEKMKFEDFKQELQNLGLSENAVEKLITFINIKSDNDDIINDLKALDVDSKEFTDGVEELCEVINCIKAFMVPENNYKVDLTIARGLDYYTGTVYETFLNDYPDIGSVCSGGRYDNLAQNYTNKKLPGVGISIGLSRLFYQLTQAGFFSEVKKSTPTKLLVIPMNGYEDFAINTATIVRDNGIPAEVYMNDGKLGKKIGYADKLGIPYVIVVGEDEKSNGVFRLKEMKTGEQIELTVDEIIKRIINI